MSEGMNLLQRVRARLNQRIKTASDEEWFYVYSALSLVLMQIEKEPRKDRT